MLCDKRLSKKQRRRDRGLQRWVRELIQQASKSRQEIQHQNLHERLATWTKRSSRHVECRRDRQASQKLAPECVARSIARWHSTTLAPDWLFADKYSRPCWNWLVKSSAMRSLSHIIGQSTIALSDNGLFLAKVRCLLHEQGNIRIYPYLCTSCVWLKNVFRRRSHNNNVSQAVVFVKQTTQNKTKQKQKQTQGYLIIQRIWQYCEFWLRAKQ